MDFDSKDDYDNDGLLNTKEIDWNSPLIKDKSLKTYESLPTVQECIGYKKELTYVENGLKRLQTLPGNVYSELITKRILPINSDPLSIDGDGDGLLDNKDPIPLKPFDDRFVIVKDYNYVPDLNFVREHKTISDMCYGTKAPFSNDYELGIYEKALIDYQLLNLVACGGYTAVAGFCQFDTIGYNSLPHASQFLFHFLFNSGEALELSQEEVYSVIFSSKRNQHHYYENINSLRSVCEEIVIDGEKIIVSSSDENDFVTTCYKGYNCDYLHKGLAVNNNIDFDWSYSIGESFGGMVAEVSRSKDIIEIKYKYYIIDYYEWGWHAEGNDYEQHMLHECGLAREYPVIGYYESIETWKVGDRYENT